MRSLIPNWLLQVVIEKLLIDEAGQSIFKLRLPVVVLKKNNPRFEGMTVNLPVVAKDYDAVGYRCEWGTDRLSSPCGLLSFSLLRKPWASPEYRTRTKGSSPRCV
jgi:hypothetical protein